MRNPRINPVTHAVEQWVHQLPAELLSCVGASHVDLLKSFPSAYAVYPPLLLWPRHTFSSLSWKDIRTRAHPDDLERLYSSVADAAKVEYIAVNHGIPTRNASDGTENVVRSPSNLEPLYGDFGAAVTHPPTPPDLQSALWVSARQNGVVQVWAPLYTMFSQGNVSEKARIMTLPTLKAGVLDAATSSAVDLYGGIGYFVFSYARAGVGKVLVWEINPWSVEGLRRGAEANKWATSIRAAGSPWAVGGDERIVVFQESNDEALSRVTSARSALPPHPPRQLRAAAHFGTHLARRRGYPRPKPRRLGARARKHCEGIRGVQSEGDYRALSRVRGAASEGRVRASGEGQVVLAWRLPLRS